MMFLIRFPGYSKEAVLYHDLQSTPKFQVDASKLDSKAEYKKARC
jgi:hypothetical protein